MAITGMGATTITASILTAATTALPIAIRTIGTAIAVRSAGSGDRFVTAITKLKQTTRGAVALRAGL